MAVTSQVRTERGVFEVSIGEWQTAGLLKPSVVKPLLTTLEQGMILRRLGSLSTVDRSELKDGVGQLLG